MKPPRSAWKFLCGSATGTSHERLGEPCQDYAHALVVYTGLTSTLVVACADGAGSASHADVGARLACLGFVRLVAERLRDGLFVGDIGAGQVTDWYAAVRGRLSLAATLSNLELRDFACTLLTGIVGAEGAVFSQIGDGAIVYRDGNEFRTVFWPQTGEYASTTFFLTNQGFEGNLAFRSLGPVDELAVLTDGLQPLALHYGTRTVHGPFFQPMFETLRQTSDPETLEDPLEEFLRSEPVTDRTDDDKTLVLATRWSPSHDARELA
jgi:hypothetical protein